MPAVSTTAPRMDPRGVLLCAAGLIAAAVSATAPAADRPDFTGMWSGVMTTSDDPRWSEVEFVCSLGCSAQTLALATALLDDPANAQRTIRSIIRELQPIDRRQFADLATPAGAAAIAAFDPATNSSIQCHPYGYFKQVMSPLPLEITQADDHVVFHYEQFAAVRTVHTDGREAPAAPPALLGHSVGRYEGSTLIVETRGVIPDSFFDLVGGEYTDQLHAVERYTRSPDGKWLHLELTVEDPVMLRGPWTRMRTWLLTPDVEMLPHSCDAISGVR